MENTRYAVWFLTVVALAILALMGFNALAGAYILHHSAGGSTQTLSGFERALKPVWLEQIQPELVFVGSSRVRDGFDPVLIDPAFATRSFNYGASSITPYEARRFAQDALAAWSLAQLKDGQGAGDRPDIFPAYAHMSEAVMQKDLAYRRARVMRMGDGAARELSTLLAAACSSPARLTLFFPPDNMAIIARYRQGDAAGLAAFKRDVGALVARHNGRCRNKAALFDFMAPNALTSEALENGSSRDYVDLVHFRPPAGVWLLKQMGVKAR